MKEKVIRARTLYELILGIVIFGIVFQIGMIIYGVVDNDIGSRMLYFSLGIWVGIVLAIFYVIHMNNTLVNALDYDSETATKLVKKGSLIRYGALSVVMGLIMITNVISPVTAMFGILGIKAGAYLNGICHKILTCFVGEEVLPPIIEHLEDEKSEKKTDESVNESADKSDSKDVSEEDLEDVKTETEKVSD